MEVSKLEISDKLKFQGLTYEVLCWMRDHEKACRNTNIKNIAKTMGLSRDFAPHTTTNAIDSAIHKLLRRGLIIRRGANLWRSDYIVNHGHPEMPSAVDEGIIKTTPINRKSPTEIFRANGKSISQYVLEWMMANPFSLCNTTARELAKKIYDTNGIEAKINSIEAVIGVMARDGRIKRVDSALDKAKYTFYVPKPAAPNVSAKEIFRANGKSIAELIIEWMEKYPLKLLNTTTGELAQTIVNSGEFIVTKESAQTILARLVREGRVLKYKLGPRPRDRANFRLAQVEYKEPEISPDTDYEVIEENKTPQEQCKIAKEAVIAMRDKIWFNENEEMENKMEEQTVNLPNGGTIHLTININIGK